MDPTIAAQTAELMIETDLLGIDSHGISMLPHYHKLLKAEKWHPAARAKIVSQTPVIAVIDGCDSLGHATAMLAMQTAIDKAKKLGMGAAAVRNSNHFGAAGSLRPLRGVTGHDCTGDQHYPQPHAGANRRSVAGAGY